MRILLLIITIFYAAGSSAQQRGTLKLSLNENWQFSKNWKEKDADWQPVQLPHTWNADDVMDDEPGYYRGKASYKRRLYLNDDQKQQVHYLHFEGVGQSAEVWVNGKLAGKHAGGYAAFSIAIDSFLKWGNGSNPNEIQVIADNSHQPDLAPLTADFTFYGGIYRDVYLISAGQVHLEKETFGTDAFYITPQIESEKAAAVKIKATITNVSAVKQQVLLAVIVRNREGQIVAAKEQEVTLLHNSKRATALTLPAIAAPKLWSPEEPYLYSVSMTIRDKKTGKVWEEAQWPVGFRWYEFDSKRGFVLNGKPYKLIGASRHQDYAGKGNAVPDELAVRDVTLLKEMGGNFLRVAHYPQDPAVLQACDRLGIIASVEIPVVNEITTSEAFYKNCEAMLREMIHQRFNHTSVVIWCYMNEVLLRMPYGNDKEKQAAYLSAVTALAQQLDSTARAIDPGRYTMIAHHGDFNKYHTARLTEIPMLVGWNLYSGWYGGAFKDFASFLDRHHTALPHKPLLVTEYGADADPRIRSFNPVRFDKSLEYTTAYHQFYLQAMMERPFVAAAMIWNLADFNSETREETMPHINNKGLLTWDRKPKDGYLFYQSQLASQPYLRIAAGTGWTQRAGVADSSGVCYQPVQVMTNMDSIIFLHNGRMVKTVATDKGVAACMIPFAAGENRISVQGKNDGKQYGEEQRIRFLLIPYQFSKAPGQFSALNILLGANRYFLDESRMTVWIPDQPYRSGSFGYIGGKDFRAAQNSRLPYGTDRNIKGTESDPIYQTQRIGLSEYKLDVPAGNYELTLHWAELEGGAVSGLVYNLGDTGRKEQVKQRVFDVLVNDSPVMTGVNLAEQYGLARAVSKKIIVNVLNDAGIHIRFRTVAGEPVLNALQLVKLD